MHAPKPAPPGYIPCTEATKRSGLSRSSLIRAIRAGRFEASRAGTGEIMVDEKTFMAWIAARNSLTPITPAAKKPADET